MRINVYLRGIDLLDLEFHAGSKGIYVDLSVFQPRAPEVHPEPPESTSNRADLSGTDSLLAERAPGPVWEDDQPAVVRFGFSQ